MARRPYCPVTTLSTDGILTLARLAFALPAILALLAVTGCGSDSKPTSPTAASTPAPVQSVGTVPTPATGASTSTVAPTATPVAPAQSPTSTAAPSPTTAATAPPPTATSAPPPPPTPTPAPTLPTSATVAVGGAFNAFDPPTVTIAAGGTVTWEWQGGVHDVTFDGFASETKGSGNFVHTFTTPGTFAYVCTVHQSTGMRGTVIVR